MKKNTEAQRRHKLYLRAKNALRDQHQDDYTLMLERHAVELDTLWANYNLAVKKLASEHNKKAVKAKAKAIKSDAIPMKKGVLCVQPEENVIH
jgi:hypothetical protein